MCEQGTCAIVGAASFNAAHFLGQRFDYVIAVDGGFDHVRGIGCEPDVAVGDFDSLGYVPQHSNVVRHPVMKDDSDLMLALQYAFDLGYRRFAIYGALGGRLDHTIATLQSLTHFARLGSVAFAVGEDEMTVALHGGGFEALSLPARESGTFSVFATGGDARGVTECGGLYELSDATLRSDQPLGLSNEFVGNRVEVSVADGDLLVVMPLMSAADV